MDFYCIIALVLMQQKYQYVINLCAGVAEWQTRATQNREGNRGGSSPFTGTTKKLL